MGDTGAVAGLAVAGAQYSHSDLEFRRRMSSSSKDRIRGAVMMEDTGAVAGLAVAGASHRLAHLRAHLC